MLRGLYQNHERVCAQKCRSILFPSDQIYPRFILKWFGEILSCCAEILVNDCYLGILLDYILIIIEKNLSSALTFFSKLEEYWIGY
jgi:hypothetical protein